MASWKKKLVPPPPPHKNVSYRDYQNAQNEEKKASLESKAEFYRYQNSENFGKEKRPMASPRKGKPSRLAEESGRAPALPLRPRSPRMPPSCKKAICGRGVYSIPRPCPCGTCFQHSVSCPADLGYCSQSNETVFGPSVNDASRSLPMGANVLDDPSDDIEFSKKDFEKLPQQFQQECWREREEARATDVATRNNTRGGGCSYTTPMSDDNYGIPSISYDSHGSETFRKNYTIPVQPVDVDPTECSDDDTTRKEFIYPGSYADPAEYGEDDTERKECLSVQRYVNVDPAECRDHDTSRKKFLHVCSNDHRDEDDETQAKGAASIDYRQLPLSDECRSKLRTFTVEIYRGLCIGSFLDSFISISEMSEIQTSRIRERKTEREQIIEVVDIILRGSQFLYNAFLRALQMTNQIRLYELLIGPGDAVVEPGVHSANLRKCRLTLCENLRFEDLFPHLLEKNVINDYHKEVILAKASRQEKASVLLDVILRDGREITVLSFLESLEQSGQHHLAHCVKTGSAELIMSRDQKARITANLAVITDYLELEKILPIMVEEKSITDGQYEEIIAQRGNTCALLLIDILKCRPKKAYQTFVRALQATGLCDLAKRLVDDPVNYTSASPLSTEVKRPPVCNRRIRRRDSVYISRRKLPRLMRVLQTCDGDSSVYIPLFDKALDNNVLDMTCVEFTPDEIASFAVYLMKTKRLKGLRLSGKTKESLLGLVSSESAHLPALVAAFDKFLLANGDLDMTNCQVYHCVPGLMQYIKLSRALRHVTCHHTQIESLISCHLSIEENLPVLKYIRENDSRHLVAELLKIVARKTRESDDLIRIIEVFFLQENGLDLQGVSMSETHVKGIVIFMEKVTRLKAINLTRCCLTDDKLLPLTRILLYRPDPIRICLDGNLLSHYLERKLMDDFSEQIQFS